MTFLNEGNSDRIVRMLGGMLLLGTAWTVSLNAFAIVLFAIGGIMLATGIVGWCPAYTVFGISTVKTPAECCRNWETEHHR